MNAAYRKARKHLRRDAVLAAVIERVGPCRLVPKPEEPLRMLVDCVISQQISTKAAKAISGKLAARVKDRFTVRHLAALVEDDYRACGLSGGKHRAVRAILEHVAANRGFLKALPALDDETFRLAVTAIKGLGPWSADMMLMFAFGRPDVLPVGDYGVRVAAQRLYALDELPRPATLIAIAEPWRPYRSIASWYLWQSLSLK